MQNICAYFREGVFKTKKLFILLSILISFLYIKRQTKEKKPNKQQESISV